MKTRSQSRKENMADQTKNEETSGTSKSNESIETQPSSSRGLVKTSRKTIMKSKKERISPFELLPHKDYDISRLYVHYAGDKKCYMGTAIVENFCNDMQVHPQELFMLFFNWKLNAKKLNYFYYQQWMDGFKEMKNILTFRDLKDYVDTFENDLRGSEDFKKLYHYAYDMLNPSGYNRIEIELAIQIMEVLFQHQFKMLPFLIKYFRIMNLKRLRQDQYNSVYDFCVEFNNDISNYDPSSFWPVLFDEFVEWFLKLNGEDRKTVKDRYVPSKILDYPN